MGIVLDVFTDAIMSGFKNHASTVTLETLNWNVGVRLLQDGEGNQTANIFLIDTSKEPEATGRVRELKFNATVGETLDAVRIIIREQGLTSGRLLGVRTNF